jgi:hypothetical protein
MLILLIVLLLLFGGGGGYYGCSRVVGTVVTAKANLKKSA